MKQIITPRTFSSDEEYFLFEEKSELKHEFVNNNLIEMSGVSFEHNEIAGNIFLLLKLMLKHANCKITYEAVKVKTPDGNFFYPDIMVCSPNISKYFSTEPILIVEVLSETTRKYDLSDKFIQYQKIDTLKYYLCVEPEQQVIIFYFKDDEGIWMTETFSRDEDTISLKHLNIAITLQQIYKPQ